MSTKTERTSELLADMFDDLEALIKKLQQGAVRASFERKLEGYREEVEDLYPEAVPEPAESVDVEEEDVGEGLAGTG